MAIKGENNNKTASSQTCVLPQAKTWIIIKKGDLPKPTNEKNCLFSVHIRQKNMLFKKSVSCARRRSSSCYSCSGSFWKSLKLCLNYYFKFREKFFWGLHQLRCREKKYVQGRREGNGFPPRNKISSGATTVALRTLQQGGTGEEKTG